MRPSKLESIVNADASIKAAQAALEQARGWRNVIDKAVYDSVSYNGVTAEQDGLTLAKRFSILLDWVVANGEVDNDTGSNTYTLSPRPVTTYIAEAMRRYQISVGAVLGGDSSTMLHATWEDVTPGLDDEKTTFRETVLQDDCIPGTPKDTVDDWRVARVVDMEWTLYYYQLAGDNPGVFVQ